MGWLGAVWGVVRGWTLVGGGSYLRQAGSAKRLHGFDSFEGFGDVIGHDAQIETSEVDPNMRADGFSDTSRDLVERKLNLFAVRNVQLTPGFFETSLVKCPETSFSFVHLDCDAYESYRTCLRHFYPLMSPGGIVSLDEYNYPPWPGCNQAVDEFLPHKPDRLDEI